MDPVSRRLALFVVLSLAAALGVASGALAEQRSPAAARPDNRVAVASYDGPSAWRPLRARLRAIRSGVSGTAVRVIPSRAHPAGAYVWPRATSSAGTDRFAVSAWVRSRSGVRHVCMHVVAFASRRVVRVACARVGAGWRRITAAGRIRAASSVGVSIRSPSARTFDADNVAIRFLSSTGTSPAADRAQAAPAARWYAGASPFNQPVASAATVDPDSSALVRQLVAGAAHGFAIASKQWSFPVYTAPAGTARQSVGITASWSAYRSLDGVPIPTDAAPDPAGDGSMTILDPASGCEYDFFQARHEPNGGWSATWANATLLSSTGIYSGGWSARASGFANGVGLIRPEELAAGVIPHALVFSYPFTKAGGYVWPATDSDGESTAPGALPEGAHLQLDPTLNLDALALTPWQKTIATALQTYGMYLSDGGGTVSLYAQNPQSTSVPYPWGAVDFPLLPTSLLDHMRVLTLPPQQTAGGHLVTTPCANLR